LRRVYRKSLEIMTRNNENKQHREANVQIDTLRQSDIQHYLTIPKEIITRGYIDFDKRSYNTRILSINVNGMRIKDNEKI